jgi:hypothetical protein
VAEIQKFVKGSPKAKPDKDAIPLSLGVITMNEQQRELIERLLDALNDDKIQRLRKHELYPQDYLFVRAL